MSLKDNITELTEKTEHLIGKKLSELHLPDQNIPMTVTIVGQPQENLLGIVLKMTDSDDILDHSFTRGYNCRVVYGESQKYYITNENSTRIETNEETLSEMLCDISVSGEPVIFELEMPDELFKEISLNIVASDNDFEDEYSKNITDNSDYCFMTLNAIAVLSMSERKFLRKNLIPDMKEELGILLVRFELIPDEQKTEILNSLDNFFKKANKIYYPTESTTELYSDISALKDQKKELRSIRCKRISKKYIEYVMTEIQQAMESFRNDGDYLEDALELIREKTRKLPLRQESAARNCRMKYLSALKVEYALELSNYLQILKDKLHDEINKNEDTDKMQTIIPGYIQDSWERKINDMMESLKLSTVQVEKNLTEYIESDVYSFLGDDGNGDIAAYLLRLINLYPDVCFKGEKGTISIDKAKDFTALKKGGTIAAGVGLVMIGHPIIGISLAVYGFSKAGKGEKLKALDKDRSSIMEAADELCMKYYEQADEWLENMFRQMNENISICVSESYSRIMDSMVEVIKARKKDIEEKEITLSALQDIKTEFQKIL